MNIQKEITKSPKARRIVPLRNYIARSIDNNQNIRRYCRYHTKTPLLNKGMGYDGKMYKQADLKDSLFNIVTTDEYVSQTAGGQVIYKSAFGGDVLADRQITIYIHCPSSTFNPNIGTSNSRYGAEKVIGHHFFEINIVYPNEINELDSVEQERAIEIVNEIIDMLDGQGVDEYTKEFTGDCIFSVEGNMTDLRLGNSGYMVITIPVVVGVMSSRVNKKYLGGDTRYDK